MNKFLGILGALLMVVAISIGEFATFPASSIVEIAVAAFALTTIIIGVVKNAKERNNLSWKTVVVIVLASVAGVLCCIGGLSQNIFQEIAGAVLALLSIIFGIFYHKA